MKIRTRLAPSPTGKFHIGTARTALFNYLLAKKHGGEFVLRFEDTDRARSTKEFEDDIREGLRWLGLKWDEEYNQMDRLDIYKKFADELLKKDFAYKKEGAIYFNSKKAIEKFGIKYEQAELTKEGSKETRQGYLIRDIGVKDLISGNLSGIAEDIVIVKSDEIPTFHFGVVVDDAEMKISHVLRGQDHFSNTIHHILLQKALGFKTPEYAHIPLIFNEDRTKLSKRKNATSVSEYKEKGYLSEAIVNFLALLGWNPGDEREYFTLEELVKEFSLERVQKGPAIFNVEKLNSTNSHYIKNLTTKQLINKIKEVSNITQKMDGALFEKSVVIVKDRLKYLSEFDELTSFLINLPDYDPNILIFKKSDKEKTKKGLQFAVGSLQKAEKEWESVEKLNELLAKVVGDNGLDNGDVFWPARVALSGLEKSPSPTELLWALEKEESLKRLEKASQKLK